MSITDTSPFQSLGKNPLSRIRSYCQGWGSFVPAGNLHEYDISKSSVSLSIDDLKQELKNMHVHPEAYHCLFYSYFLNQNWVEMLVPWIGYAH